MGTGATGQVGSLGCEGDWRTHRRVTALDTPLSSTLPAPTPASDPSPTPPSTLFRQSQAPMKTTLRDTSTSTPGFPRYLPKLSGRHGLPGISCTRPWFEPGCCAGQRTHLYPVPTPPAVGAAHVKSTTRVREARPKWQVPSSGHACRLMQSHTCRKPRSWAGGTRHTHATRPPPS